MTDWRRKAERDSARIKVSFDYLNQYAAQCALSGMDISELRDASLGLGYYFGIYDVMENKTALEDIFDSVVSDALKTGKAPEITLSQKQRILRDIEYYADDIKAQGGLENLEEEAQVFEDRLRADWKLKKPEKAQDFSLFSLLSVQGDHLIVKDDAYRESKEKVSRCLRLLPDYAACLAAAGEEKEASKLKCFAYNMADFWYDNSAVPSNEESPDAFLIRFEKAVSDVRETGQYRTLSAQEQDAIRGGIQAHISEMLSDSSAMILHLRVQYKGLIEKLDQFQDRREMPDMGEGPRTAVRSEKGKAGRKKTGPER